jgi:FkbM family methyltransferase
MQSNSLKTSVLNLVRETLFQHPPAEKVLRRWTRGRAVTHWISRMVPNHYQYGSPSLRTVHFRAGGVELDLSDLMEWHLYFDFLDDTTENLVALVRPGDTVLDVGSNIGTTLVPISQKVEARGIALGFEPDPERFRKCVAFLKAQQLDPNCVSNLALGARREKKQLRVRNPLNQGMNQVCPEEFLDRHNVEISITTLDEIVRLRKLAKVDLIKIDVEGYEAHVMNGAQEIIGNLKPKFFIEVDDCNLNDHHSAPRDIYAPLIRAGYRFYKDSLSQPIDVTNQQFHRQCHFDLIAIPAATSFDTV